MAFGVACCADTVAIHAPNNVMMISARHHTVCVYPALLLFPTLSLIYKNISRELLQTCMSIHIIRDTQS